MKTSHIIAGAVVAVAVGYAVMKMRSSSGSMVYDLGYSVGGAAFNAFDGVLSGAVYGVGDAIGVPRTNMTQCEQDRAAGRTWDASFSCPAKDFISYVLS